MTMARNTPHSRRMLTAVALLVATIALGGCGGSDPKADTPDEAGGNPAAGAYKLTTQITESDLKGKKAGPDSKDTRTMFLSCADTACTDLLQRAAGSTSIQSWTAVIRPAADGALGGTHARTGPCPKKGTYREAVTWAWTRAADGKLSGTVVQDFTGCDLDGKATFSATATPVESEKVPYLDDAATEGLFPAFNTFTVGNKKFAKSRAACDDSEDESISVTETTCYAPAYRTVAKNVTALGTAISALGEPGSGACHKAVSALDTAAWSARITKTARLYKAAKNVPGLKAADKSNTTLGTYNSDRIAAALEVAAMCVNPTAEASLSKDAITLFDPYLRLQQLDSTG